MTPTIKTPRQRRALGELTNGGRSVVQLRAATGALNVPDLMAQLWRYGWRWTCERIEVIDRDGHVCRPGIYRLIPAHRQIAAEMLGGGPISRLIS